MPEPDPGALQRLVDDGLLQREGERLRPTHRWQAAMARSALALAGAGAPWGELRLPIAAALVELHPGLDDAALAPLVEAMLAVESVELRPILDLPAPAP